MDGLVCFAFTQANLFLSEHLAWSYYGLLFAGKDLINHSSYSCSICLTATMVFSFRLQGNGALGRYFGAPKSFSCLHAFGCCMVCGDFTP